MMCCVTICVMSCMPWRHDMMTWHMAWHNTCHDMKHDTCDMTRHMAWLDTTHNSVFLERGVCLGCDVAPKRRRRLLGARDFFLGCDVGGQKDTGVFLGTDPQDGASKLHSAARTKEEENNTTQQFTSQGIPFPEDCLGKWIIVKYYKKPYPGFVVDVDAGELYVDRMHEVPKGGCFFWPRMKDRLWYQHEQILAVITQPCLQDGTTNHYNVDPAVWNHVKNIVLK